MGKRQRISTPSRRGRRGRKRRRTRRMRFSKNIVPDAKIVKFRYVDTVSRNPSVGGVASTYLFRANSIFDPDFTAIGHQPLGHDEWSVFYDHYTVLGARITATFLSTSDVATSGTAICGILLKDNATPISDVRTLMEQTNSGYRVVTNADAKQKITVSKNFSTKRFFGLKDVADNRALVGAQFNNNLVEDAYFHVYVAGTAADLDPPALNIIVTIEYICKLTERRSLTGS